jgi:general secretion pathway protein D
MKPNPYSFSRTRIFSIIVFLLTLSPVLVFTQTDDESAPEKPITPAPAGKFPPLSQQSNSNPKGILLNFKDAPLADVLSYLSEAAGFVVIQEVPVSGAITVVSRQPLNADEAVDLLNAVLSEKGYLALRSGRILKIISRRNAPKRDIPVETGSDPQSIPKKDSVVTQVIPVHYADAAKLLDNIRPLLADDANLTSNESSNAIVLTDTQANVRRIAEIIQALDTSIADIGEVRVFHLQNADSGELATILNELYADKGSGGSSSRSSGSSGGAPDFFRMMSQGRSSRSGSGGQSERALLQSKVNAVGDPRTNSLIVTATRETMTQIAEMIGRLDATPDKKQKVFVYPLEYADVNNVATVIKGIFSKQTTSSQSTQSQEAAANRLSQRSANGASNSGTTSTSSGRRSSTP